ERTGPSVIEPPYRGFGELGAAVVRVLRLRRAGRVDPGLAVADAEAVRQCPGAGHLTGRVADRELEEPGQPGAEVVNWPGRDDPPDRRDAVRVTGDLPKGHCAVRRPARVDLERPAGRGDIDPRRE